MSEAVGAARAIDMLRSAGTSIDYESVLEANYSKLIDPGQVVVDAGAHTGRHLKTFRRLVGPEGHVFGVEPLPEQFSYLSEKFGGRANVTLYNLALADADGTSEFTVAKNAPEESGLQERIYNLPDTIIEKIEVKIRRLDSLINPDQPVDFIKIDVEGAEIKLLHGAVETLARARPILSVEYGYPSYSSYGNTNMTLFDLAFRLGYKCCDLYGNIIETAEEWRIVCDWVYWDYLLVPTEKAPDVTARVRS